MRMVKREGEVKTIAAYRSHPNIHQQLPMCFRIFLGDFLDPRKSALSLVGPVGFEPTAP